MKKKIVEKKVMNEKLSGQSKDAVVFMTAYKSTGLSKKLFTLKKRKKARDLLLENHISSLLIGNSAITKNGVLELELSYDSIKQSTNYKFTPKDISKNLDDFKNELEKIKWCIPLLHSLTLLLDPKFYSISYFVIMESFIVKFGTKQYQVDPIIYCMNDVTFINFELIDCATGYPLAKDDIFGRKNNYDLIPITSLKYFDDDEPTPENRKISDVIFEKLNTFFSTMLRGKYEVDQYGYVHNLFVSTKSIADVNDYFTKVLGAKTIDIQLDNLNTNGAYKYYSQDYLGVVIIDDYQYKQQAIFDVQILESLKMYVLLNQIVNFDLTNDLASTINNQIAIEFSLLGTNVPIDTVNTIKNIKKTETYKLRKNAIDVKISYLNIINERIKNRNALFLNILLYFLTFIGSLSTLQILKDEFGWPLLPCLITLSTVFIVLGLCWIFIERKK